MTHSVGQVGGRRAARPPPAEMISPRRVLSALALAAWACLFWILLLTGRGSLYLSSRTAWVIPVGAILLTCAAVGRVLALRTPDAERLLGHDAWGIGLLMLPVVVVLALPPASLGSFAAARRSSITGAGFSSSTEDISSGRLTLIDIAGALRSPKGMRALASRAGSEVSFVGFVTRAPEMGADEFLLTRFVISCCVADALSVQARVVGVPPGEFDNDDWVRVEGSLYPLGREVIVDASEVTRIAKPEAPYLSP
jgi:putative membrane protein